MNPIIEVKPESSEERNMEDAMILAGFIKSTPESFEKSLKILTHILY